MLDAQGHVSVGDNVIDTGGGASPSQSACCRYTETLMVQLLWGLTSLDFADDIISHRMSICDMMFAERLV